MNGLIVVGGSIDDKFACDIVKQGAYDVIFAADSGIDFMYRNHITPDFLIGDFDSANAEALGYYKEMDQVSVIELDSVKDDTDTEHTLWKAIQLGCDSITILGGFGTRIDHTLANISLLGVGLKCGVDIELLDPHNRIRIKDKSFTLKKKDQFGKYVSLVSYVNMVRGLTIKGMKYNVENVELDFFSSLGISNEIVEEEATISFEEGMMLVIESMD